MTSAIISNELIYRALVALDERIKNIETQIQLIARENRTYSAKDAAAVVSISNKMNSTFKSMQVTRLNLQDGACIKQTVEGKSEMIIGWLNKNTKISTANIVYLGHMGLYSVALEKLRPVGATGWSGEGRQRVVGES